LPMVLAVGSNNESNKHLDPKSRSTVTGAA
jgi:hypothetical protein